MKLYTSRRAPNPRRVRWVLAEKGVEDLELVEMDLFKNEHRAPAFLERAGLANVPALELDDGTIITESVAVCRYLESLYPEPNMFGAGAEEIAVIEMWTRRAEFLLAMPLMMSVRHAHPALAALETQSPEIAATNRSAAARAVAFFDQRLAASPFIAADRVTMADVVAFTALDFARMVKFQPEDRHQAFIGWADRMRARPAASAGV